MKNNNTFNIIKTVFLPVMLVIIVNFTACERNDIAGNMGINLMYIPTQVGMAYPTNVISHWRLDGVYHKSATGDSRGHYTLTFDGNYTGVTLPNGKFDKSPDFNTSGSNYYFYNGSDKSIFDGGSNDTFMIEAWIKPSDTGSFKTIASKRDATTGWKLSLTDSETVQFWRNTGGTTAGQQLTIDEWNFIAVMYNKTTGIVRIFVYIPGSSTPFEHSDTLASFTPTSSAQFKIGEDYNSSFKFDGQIDDVAFWTPAPSYTDAVNKYLKDRWNNGNGATYGFTFQSYIY